MNLKNLSIRGKLYVLSGAAAAIALLLATIAFSYQHISSFRQNTVNRLHSVGEVLAANTIAAITFDDPDDATEVLASLERNEAITAACIVSNDGTVFARYVRAGMENTIRFPKPRPTGYYFDSGGELEMFLNISDGDELKGVLYLRSSMSELFRSLNRYAVMASFVFIISLSTALLLSSRLQTVITLPVKELVETTEKISANHDYSTRVRKHASDEIGTLYDAFNDMLEQIETSEKALIKARNDLEERVRERTSQLTESNARLIREMDEKQKMQRRLIDASRQAGMAEVATGVLHNVGNVLNSVNVSANLVRQKIEGSRLSSLLRLSGVINENMDDLPAFVGSQRGSRLPQMLEQLGSCLQNERQYIVDEVDSLQTNIDHIKEIVASQQSFGSMIGVAEEVNLSEVINDAVNIGGGTLNRYHIDIERDFGEIPRITMDRHKVMQILVNLVRNAGQAITASSRQNGKIILRTALCSDQSVSIQVIDNGIGIDSEALNKIFVHGFTTKKEGHGFGLHSSALAAREMGGSLSVKSDGPDCGATFTLRLMTQSAS